MPFGPKDFKHVDGVDLGELHPIDGIPGYYITKCGRVFSVYELSQREDPDGYLRVSSGRLKNSIHRLLALTFVKNRKPNQSEVRHLDGNRQNNSLKNLAWGTRKENAQDMARHGTVKGEKNSTAILTEENVKSILRNPDNKTMKQLAVEFGVSKSAISAVVNRTNWRHVEVQKESKP